MELRKGNNKRGNNITKDNKNQAAEIKNIKDQIALLEQNIINDTKEDAAEEDEGDREPCVWFEGIVDDDRN